MGLRFFGDEAAARQAWQDFEDFCNVLGKPTTGFINGNLAISCNHHFVSTMRKPEGICAGESASNDFSAMDERFTFSTDDFGDTLKLEAATVEGLFRGLTHLLAGEDAPKLLLQEYAPRYSYRALTLDVARYRASVSTIKTVIDVLALQGMSALHLHLTDHQSWRLPIPGFDRISSLNDVFSSQDLAEISCYAHKRHVSIIPEIDLPGHCAALLSVYPQLSTREFAHPMLSYISADAEGVDDFLDGCVEALCTMATGPFVHIGGDEVFGMPHDEYDRIISTLINKVHQRGKKVIAWQEACRAQVPADVYQYWMTDRDIPSEEDLVRSWPDEFKPFAGPAAAMYAQCLNDPDRFREKNAFVIDSRQTWMYLDRKYAEKSCLAEQNKRMENLGFPNYEPHESTNVFDLPELSNQRLGGIEAALWTETVNNPEDIATLLLPRLALLAHLAWDSNPIEGSVKSGKESCAQLAQYWDALGMGDYYRSELLFS